MYAGETPVEQETEFCGEFVRPGIVHCEFSDLNVNTDFDDEVSKNETYSCINIII